MKAFLLDTVTQLETATEPFKAAPSLIKLGVSLAALILILVVLVWILKKISGHKGGFFSSNDHIKILERKAISPKTVLFLVEVDDEKMLVSESSHHVKITKLQTETLE